MVAAPQRPSLPPGRRTVSCPDEQAKENGTIRRAKTDIGPVGGDRRSTDGIVNGGAFRNLHDGVPEGASPNRWLSVRSRNSS